MFAMFWTVGLISNLGTWVHELAAGYLMAILEPSPVWVSLVRTSMSLPVFCLALFAGAIADRVDRRRLLLATQVFLCGVTASMAALAIAGLMTPILLLATTFAIGLGMCLHVPTWQTIYPQIVQREQIPAAVGLGSLSFNLARCVGPALSGIVITLTSVGTAFVLNALSFGGIIFVLATWKPERKTSPPPPGERLGRSVALGLRYLLSEGGLRSVYLRLILFVVPASAVWALIPLVATQKYSLGPQGFGLLISAFGLGAILGVALLPRLRNKLGSGGTVAMLSAAFGVCCGLVPLGNREALGLFAMLGMGTCWMGVLTTLNSTIQLHIDDRFRARGMSLYLTVMSAGMASGSLLWGFVAERGGLDAAFAIAAVASSVFAAAANRFVLRELTVN